MPISLPPISRRAFLRSSAAAAAAMLAGCAHRGAAGKGGFDADRLVLVSDTHLHANKGYVHATGARPWQHFEQVCREVTALRNRPGAVLFCGDCAYHKGLPEDYATFVQAIAPLREAGLPLHMAVGNHDERKALWNAVGADQLRQGALPERQVLRLETARADLYLLDSLEVTDKTPGSLGAEQLRWLASALDTNPQKPAIVMAHHDLGTKPGSLRDSKALMDVMLPRKQVKAYVYGHTHVWTKSEVEGLHLVNLPPTAWLFDQKLPNGWVDLRLENDGATFQLHALKHEHARHLEKYELAWR